MFRFIRQFAPQLRPWLLAAAAILLLTSVLEAGHGHGVFVPADDACAICQQVISLDKILITHAISALPPLVALLILSVSIAAKPPMAKRFAPIRAPPVPLHSR